MLKARLPTGSIVVDELPLGGGGPADVGVVTPCALHLFEIKSDADSCRRLPDQVRNYSLQCSTATLVVGFQLADKCVPLVPDWWGVVGAWDGGLQTIREAQPNPSPDKTYVANMLWSGEVRSELIARSLGRPRGWSAKLLLASSLTDEELREAVHRHMAVRRWTIFRKRQPQIIGIAS